MEDGPNILYVPSIGRGHVLLLKADLLNSVWFLVLPCYLVVYLILCNLYAKWRISRLILLFNLGVKKRIYAYSL